MLGRDGGWAGMADRAGRGAGAGPGRGGGGWTCVFLRKNVRRNRLECRFGAEYRGENPVLFTAIFREVQDISLVFPDFFLREKSGEFEGKIRCYHSGQEHAYVIKDALPSVVVLPLRRSVSPQIGRNPQLAMHQSNFFVPYPNLCWTR